MGDRDDPIYSTPYSRRRFIQQAGAAGLAGLAAPLLGSAAAGAATRTARTRIQKAASTPIRHIIVCCQENHSFDHYFGSYPGLPSGYGIPPGFTQPDGHGGVVRPFHFASLTDNGSLNYPCILDLLKSHGITFKNYNFNCPNNYSILACSRTGHTAEPATSSTRARPSSSATAGTTRFPRCPSSPRRRPTTAG